VRMDRVIQHLDPVIIKRMLSQIRLCLKPGGILVVTEPVWTMRHFDLGLDDTSENARIHDEVTNVARRSIKNPAMGRSW
jgi:hypothetical protein